MQGVEKHGPYGSNGPPNWSAVLDSRQSVKELSICYLYVVNGIEYVCGIEFVVADNCGSTTTKMIGYKGDVDSDKVTYSFILPPLLFIYLFRPLKFLHYSYSLY